MGRRNEKVSIKDRAARNKALAESNGYRRGEHTVVDSRCNVQDQGEDIRRNQDMMLRAYLDWNYETMEAEYQALGLPDPTDEEVEERYLGNGVQLPDLVTMKDFLRYVLKKAKGRIYDVPVVKSGERFVEWICGGFQRRTGTVVGDGDRSELYKWVRTAAKIDGLVVKGEKPKYNYGPHEAVNALRSLWCMDDLIYIPNRYRVQFHFLLLIYCETGARISAFFKGGFRYKDIKLVLQREGEDGWRLVYEVDQRFVKNNRDPDYVRYSSAGRGHKVVLFNASLPLLAMALADDAIVGMKSVRAFEEVKWAEGERERTLRFEDHIMDVPIVRTCPLGQGVSSTEKWHKSAFEKIFHSTFENTGYFKNPNIHAIRRYLGKMIDERYTEVERSEHLIQNRPSIFQTNYTARCSAVDGLAAYLGEKPDHSHIEFFQSLRRFREVGLPTELPAQIENDLKEDPELLERKARVHEARAARDLERAATEPDSSAVAEKEKAVKDAEKDRDRYRKQQRAEALATYQRARVREIRDERVLRNGEVQLDISKTDVTDCLFYSNPHRKRLNLIMQLDDPPCFRDSMTALEDMRSLCLQDPTVLYLNGCEPVDGRCPAKSCHRKMDSLPKPQRNSHIQNCVRKSWAKAKSCLVTQVHYCYICYQWELEGKWEGHCSEHVELLSTKRCGSITKSYTLLRPGFCPFCLSGGSSAVARLRSYQRDYQLWAHVKSHIQKCQWPQPCPHPLCTDSFPDEHALEEHFVDCHKLTLSGTAKSSLKRKVDPEPAPTKRARGDEPGLLDWRVRPQPAPTLSLYGSISPDGIASPSLPSLRSPDIASASSDEGGMFDALTPPEGGFFPDFVQLSPVVTACPSDNDERIEEALPTLEEMLGVASLESTAAGESLKPCSDLAAPAASLAETPALVKKQKQLHRPRLRLNPPKRLKLRFRDRDVR